MAKPKSGFRFILGPEFNRLQRSVGPMIHEIDSLVIRASGNLAKKWVSKLKKNAPTFSSYLIDSIELREGGKRSTAGGQGLRNRWFITVDAPYAQYQEEGTTRHWVGRGYISPAGYFFGDWMDAHGFDGPGMWVGGGKSKMGNENAFFDKTQEEMVPIAERQIAEMFAKTDRILRRRR